MNVRDLIKKHEGYSSTVYKCPAGKNTIGWGHNIDANPLPKDIEGRLFANGVILPEDAERLLDQDILTATLSCKRLYLPFDKFSENRQAALTDFLFNAGEGTAKQFKRANAAINSLAWDTAANEMTDSEWYKQTGLRGKEITSMIREG